MPKAIVIGAGIGGLTAAIALKQVGYEVEVYDRVQDLRPVGAGISLWSNGVKVLNHLGLGAKMAQIGGQMNRMEYRTATGEVLNTISLLPLIEQVQQRPYPVARRDLQALLLEGLEDLVHLDHCCINLEEDANGVVAYFDNGHQARGDLLVAADGIRSVLRRFVLGYGVDPQYAGYVNWNGLVPAADDLAPADCWVIYVGDHKRASLMPVGGERFYFFLDVPLPLGTPNQPDSYQNQLKQHFAGWADPVQRLIERMDPFTVARPEICDVGPIDSYARGRVALLGDAAHATCPDLGQGGCQAMEDGYVLARYLATAPTPDGIPEALQGYSRERVERASAVVRKARSRAEQIHGLEPEITQKWYLQLAHESPADVTGAIAKVILAGPLG